MADVLAWTGGVTAALVVIALVIRFPPGVAVLPRAQLVPGPRPDVPPGAGEEALAGTRPWWRHALGWLSRLSIDQWRAIDAETVRDPDEAGRTSAQVLIVMVTVAASLTLQEYHGGHDVYEGVFPSDGSADWELRYFAWWSGWRVLG